MDTLTATAASGMRSRIEALDLLANNISNAGTAGYKADQESYNLYFGESAWDGFQEGRPTGAEMPVIEKTWTDLSQGILVDTGNMSDVALASSGFFVVQASSGPIYTRSGHFRISKQGILETQEGYQVLSAGGTSLQLDPAQPFTISRTGQVSQNGVSVGALRIMDAESVDALTKRGGTYFSMSASSKPSAVVNPDVLQGKIEASNVPAPQAAIKIVGVMRQFEMLQRAVRLAGDMNKQAVEQVAKVSG